MTGASLTLSSALIALQATAVPMPAPSASACPGTEASMIKAVQPEFPAGMPADTMPFVVQIMVTVNPDGSVKRARVFESSDYPDADDAAVKAAEASTYKPKTVDCKAVEGRYLFRAEYDPGPPG